VIGVIRKGCDVQLSGFGKFAKKQNGGDGTSLKKGFQLFLQFWGRSLRDFL